jgi:hypothetical protein
MGLPIGATSVVGRPVILSSPRSIRVKGPSGFGGVTASVAVVGATAGLTSGTTATAPLASKMLAPARTIVRAAFTAFGRHWAGRCRL